jgi:hypothetical protein
LPIAAADMPKIATATATNIPTFDPLTIFQEAINLHAIAIPSPHGDTNLGFLHLVTPETDWFQHKFLNLLNLKGCQKKDS